MKTYRDVNTEEREALGKATRRRRRKGEGGRQGLAETVSVAMWRALAG